MERVLAIGDRLLDYELEEELGQGGYGQVWRARHGFLDTRVAIKVVREGAGEGGLRQLGLEGRLMHGLDHPGIVKVQEVHFSNDPPFLVMDLVEGQDLARRLRAGPLSAGELGTVFAQIVEALGAAHQAGVLHRDLKPSNILLAGQGGEIRARLTDFGLAFAEGEAAEDVLSRSMRSEEGRVVGTFQYIAPEVSRGEEPASPASDLYSLGVLLFEMATGRLPQGADRPSELREELPDWVDAVFLGLYTRRARRLADCAAVRERMSATVAKQVAGAISLGAVVTEAHMPADEGRVRFVKERQQQIPGLGPAKQPRPMFAWKGPAVGCGCLVAVGVAGFILFAMSARGVESRQSSPMGRAGVSVDQWAEQAREQHRLSLATRDPRKRAQHRVEFDINCERIRRFHGGQIPERYRDLERLRREAAEQDE